MAYTTKCSCERVCAATVTENMEALQQNNTKLLNHSYIFDFLDALKFLNNKNRLEATPSLT